MLFFPSWSRRIACPFRTSPRSTAPRVQERSSSPAAVFLYLGALAAALLLTPDPASAQSTRLGAPSDSVVVDQKSPSRALAYSLGGTVLLAPLFGAGLVAGPAAGHFYAGNSGQAWAGIGIRSGAFLTAGLGMGLIWGSTQPTGFKSDPDGEYDPTPPFGDRARTAGVVLFGAGIAALLGSATYDVATVRGATKEQNRSRAVQAQVAPAVGPHEQVGLSIRIQF
jgi:hypothetical protein